MSDLIVTGTSDYAIGGIDSATVLVSNVSPISARHPNGVAAGVVQIETILGSGTSLKGSTADLATRLAVALNNTGTHKLTGFTGLTTDRGLLALSATEMQVMNHTPIGIIAEFGGSVAPANWLMADGQAVSRATYAKLFAVYGTTHGVGNGSTTFNVPDKRGRVGVGVDGSANRITSASTNGTNADTLGGVGGTETHVLSAAEAVAQAHTHGIAAANNLNGGSQARLASTDAASNPFTFTSDSGGGGANAAHSNTQPWIALNYIIFAGV